ncbi:MAG TPA: GntG family PLP-dependent aldolase [Polyangiaceae bacterium]
MTIVDLRSDTVTQPSPAMRRVMAEAEVGDDVFSEDPSVRELEAATAELLGKPRALFVPSGTMGNQLALLTQTRPGNQVVVGHGAHIACYEAGAGAAWAGVQFAVAGQRGCFDADEFEQVLTPQSAHAPKSVLVCLENTHNHSGGRIFPERDVLAISAVARKHGLRLHLDGARLWHASAATGIEAANLAAPFDSVSVCFSKGLGAPVGSALAGDDALIREAWRFRKMLGGGMRQAGVLAAGALFALRHQRDTLVYDHEKAKSVAAILRDGGLTVVEPDTNIVMIQLTAPAHTLVEACGEQGVLFFAMGSHLARLVLHRDVSSSEAIRAAHVVVRCQRELSRPKS